MALAGGCITGYRLRDGGGFDLLRPFDGAADSTGANRLAPTDAACFPLLPYSNRIRDGRFRFDGRDYQLPLNFAGHPHSIHGIGWQTQWHLRAQAHDRVILGLDHAADGGWPFAFAATETVRLDGAALRIELALTNTGDTAMPAGLGLHPYFPRHGGATLRAEVDAVWRTDACCLPTERIPCPDAPTLREKCGLKLPLLRAAEPLCASLCSLW